MFVYSLSSYIRKTNSLVLSNPKFALYECTPHMHEHAEFAQIESALRPFLITSGISQQQTARASGEVQHTLCGQDRCWSIIYCPHQDH
jgi:hypothetical protein